MPTRREFIQTSSLAAAAAVALPRQQPDTLPPSLRALSSQKARARPISVAERQARIGKARPLLAAEKLGALMLTGGTSLRYFANMEWELSERLLALIIPREGRAFVVCPA